MPQRLRECILRAARRALRGSHQAPNRWCRTNPLTASLSIERDAPIIHFRSQAVSGMMSLCNAEGRERESNDGNTMVDLDTYQHRESTMATQLTDIVESSQAERLA